MKHSEGFLKVVNDAKTRIKEVTVDQTRQRLTADSNALLVDVREDHEWTDSHAAGAIHLGKGIIERDIETAVPDKATELILYCGGGYRSALAADVLQNMENYGVQPDIRVDNSPEDNLAGRDRQLEVAVDDLMKQLGAPKRNIASKEQK